MVVSIDGYFIYKALVQLLDKDSVKILIDNHNKFINISFKINKKLFVFLDSYRIFFLLATA